MTRPILTNSGASYVVAIAVSGPFDNHSPVQLLLIRSPQPQPMTSSEHMTRRAGPWTARGRPLREGAPHQVRVSTKSGAVQASAKGIERDVGVADRGGV